MKSPSSPDSAAGAPTPHRQTARGVSIAIFVVGLVGGAIGYNALVQRQKQSTVDGGKPTATEARKESPAPSLPPEQAAACQKSLADIRKMFASIPEDFRKAASIEDLTRTARTCRDQADEFLRTCRGVPDEHEVQFILARCILILNRVEWTAFVNAETGKGRTNEQLVADRDDWASRYFGRVIELATASLAGWAEGAPMRAKCLDVLGDAYYQDGKPSKALERYLQLQKEFPAYSDRANLYLAIGRCYLDLGKFAEGIAVIRTAMAELPGDPRFPFFYESLWALHTGAGDLPGLLKLAVEVRAALPERLKNPAVTREEKEAAERYLCYGGFRMGYIRFALGDFPGAIEAFRDHLAAYDDPQNPEKKSTLPQDYQVYLTRSKDNLDVLNLKIGRAMPASLDRVIWTGGRRPELSAGKPLAIIFRNQGDDRSTKFVQAIDAHWRKHRDRFELVVISFLRGTGEPDAVQAEQASVEAQSMGIECPLGLDPDIKEKQLFDAFDATVGSATFAIMDRAGSYVWFQQDPWQRDVAFSTAILERYTSP